jgi:catechol 2,3-dioxygenase-like lactoylglutathione lyase family enzyme
VVCAECDTELSETGGETPDSLGAYHHGVRPALSVFVVPTTKLAESIAFYQDGIGLELKEEWIDMGRGALLAASDGCEVELIEVEAVAEPVEPSVTIGFKLERGVDDVYQRLLALGARTKARPRMRSWGMYGFGTFDPSGVPVNIYEPAGDS